MHEVRSDEDLARDVRQDALQRLRKTSLAGYKAPPTIPGADDPAQLDLFDQDANDG